MFDLGREITCGSSYQEFQKIKGLKDWNSTVRSHLPLWCRL